MFCVFMLKKQNTKFRNILETNKNNPGYILALQVLKSRESTVGYIQNAFTTILKIKEKNLKGKDIIDLYINGVRNIEEALEKLRKNPLPVLVFIQEKK